MQEIKFKNKSTKYSVFIGKNTLNLLPKKINLLCPKTEKIALIFDTNVPRKFEKRLKKKLKNYKLFFLYFNASEKSKSINTIEKYINFLLAKNFNRSDLIISVGGGISGDVTGFIASIYKRGVNFINIPTTLLAQVDSSIGGKTGVNSSKGKNLIGSFFQPKLVIIDTLFLDSLPKKEMICGYAEILKHSIIKDKKFFNWLKKNTKSILQKNSNELIYAIKKSCQIKMYFVNKDVNEKNLRMILNFGHTFAHAIEIKKKFSKNITHGEAVLIGMILATKLSCARGLCSKNTLKLITEIYEENNLHYILNKFSGKKDLMSLIPFLKNDKKNNDKNINFILLKKIGLTTKPDSCKISLKKLNYYFSAIAQ